MTSKRTMWIAAAGGIVAAIVVGVAVVMAQTPGATPSDRTPSANATPGMHKSNEDATHEANEPADREAAEDSGQGFHGGHHGGGSNEDPAHEANEPADRESQEASGTAPGGTTTPGGGA